MRLIDADEAVKIIKRYDDRGIALDEVTRITDGIAREIEAMPTVDAEPVRHGEWLADYDCGEIVLSCSLCDEHYWIENVGFVYDKPKFCPSCGAKMDLGEGEE